MKNNKTTQSHQSYAPFGSASIKAKAKKNKQEPGPGSYEVSLPIILPIVQTIRKKNNNVIVKLGHIGTAPFQGQNSRFKEELHLASLGPGQYFTEEDLKMLLKDRRHHHRSIAGEKIKELIKFQPERKATISQIRQIAIDDYIEMPEQKKKAQIFKLPDHVKGSVWSKMTEERGREMKVRSVSVVGPGQYNPGLGKAVKGDSGSAAFKSESVRSFFDQIYFETNQQKKAKEREENKYKSEVVGPGSYNVVEKRKEFHKYQFFGSTEDRKV